jgi:hypothetical protein
MAKVTVFYRPGHIAIVTGTAILTVDYAQHVDGVPACLELEAEISMADFAAKSNSVKPVRKDDGAHAGIIRELVYYDVTIFGVRKFLNGKYASCYKKSCKDQDFNRSLHTVRFTSD